MYFIINEVFTNCDAFTKLNAYLFGAYQPLGSSESSASDSVETDGGVDG
jgi:hypothetical protein